MKELYGEVYSVKNLVTGKVYVGQTIRGLDARMYRHFRSAKKNSKLPFHIALLKYGNENFKCKIEKKIYLDEKLSKEEKRKLLLQEEKKMINFYNSSNSKYGYNLEKDIELKTKFLIQKIHKYRLNGFTLQSIASHFKISKARIAYLERKHLKSKEYNKNVKNAKCKMKEV